MKVQPYLYFDGRCEEALEFYKRVLSIQVEQLMRFKQNPDPQASAPGMAEKVMHAAFRLGDTTVFASDGRCLGHPSFQGFCLSLIVKTDDEAKRLYDALADGGQVQMPLTKTFFSSSFGMVADRFGMNWMVLVQ